MAGVVVGDPRQRGPEAGDVSSTFGGVDVVGEAVENFLIGVVVLEGDLDGDLAPFRRIDHAGHVERLLVEGRFVFVEMLDELADAAFVEEALVLPPSWPISIVRPLLRKASSRRRLASSRSERSGSLRRFLCRARSAPSSRSAGSPHWLADHGAVGNTSGEGHVVNGVVAIDGRIEFLERALTTETPTPWRPAGHFVALAFEFTAGVKLGQHDLQGGQALGWVDGHGNATSVVFDGD